MRRLLAFALLAVLLPLAPAAQEATPTVPPAGGPYAATDGSGRALTFDAPVERVACLYRTCDAYLADLGLPPVATNEPADSLLLPRLFGARAADIAVFEGESVEEVARYEPDLILILVGPRLEETRAAMEPVAPVFMVAPNEQIAGFDRDLRALGALTGRTARAEAAIARFAGVLAAIVAKAPPEAANLRAMFLFDTDPENYYLAFKGTLVCNLIEANGLGTCPIPPPSGLEIPYGVVDAEVVLQTDPDLIGVIGTSGGAEAPPRVDPVWPRLTAVAEGRVYYDASFGLYCCGLREVQWSLELYVHRAFPGAGYPDPGPADAHDPGQPVNALVLPLATPAT